MQPPFAVLLARARRDPAQPFVTWYGPGGRAELSVVTFATSVAKTAGLLLDELDLEPGDVLRVELPLHWQLPVWLAAADVAGITVTWAGPAAAVVVPEPSAGSAAADETVVVSAPTPFGIPAQPVPPAMIDHHAAALGQPDVFAGAATTGDWLVDGVTWVPVERDRRCLELGRRCGVGPASRVLLGPGTDPVTAGLASWLLPLRTGGSSVLVQDGDAAHIALVEEATTRL